MEKSKRVLLTTVRTPRGEVSIYKYLGGSGYFFVANTEESVADAVDLQFLQEEIGKEEFAKRLGIEVH